MEINNRPLFIQLRDEIVGEPEDARQVWLECSLLELCGDCVLYLCSASDEWKRIELDDQGNWCVEGHPPFAFCFIRSSSGASA